MGSSTKLKLHVFNSFTLGEISSR